MSSDNWIEIINRAIQMSADWEVEDSETGVTFVYDVEALNEMLVSIEAGATSDEIVHQFGDYVGSDFERYISVLSDAMDSTEEDVEPDPSVDLEEETPIRDESFDENRGFDTEDGFDEGGGDEHEPPMLTKKKTKKGLIVGGALAGLLAVIGSGGFVFYNLLSGPSTPVASTNNVQSLKATPKPASESEAQAENSNSNQPQRASERVVSVTPMGNPDRRLDQQEQARSPAVQASNTQMSDPIIRDKEVDLSKEQIEDIRSDLEEQMARMEDVVSSRMSERLGGIQNSLKQLESRLSMLDQLESRLDKKESEDAHQARQMKDRLKGLTRLGEFSVLTRAGVDNRVVALSPTNRVITLEEGEQNITAAGSNLTVKEIIGDGEAVIFSDGWFIDKVRAPESLREKRVSAAQQREDSKDKSRPETRTAGKSDSPNPASIQASRSNVVASNSDERFPSIKQAPQGWAATALIPPRRAVIMTPDGNSITITPGTEIAGLGKVHSVKTDRVLAGQFYIPLSNL